MLIPPWPTAGQDGAPSDHPIPHLKREMWGTRIGDLFQTLCDRAEIVSQVSNARPGAPAHPHSFRIQI